VDSAGEGDDALKLLEPAEAALDQAARHAEVLVERGFSGARRVTASDRDGGPVRDGLALRIGVAGRGRSGAKHGLRPDAPDLHRATHHRPATAVEMGREERLRGGRRRLVC